MTGNTTPTKESVLEKIEEMLPNIQELVVRKATQALDSGAINLEDYKDNYLLPKIILCAIGDVIQSQYKPPMKKDQKEVKNIRYFI